MKDRAATTKSMLRSGAGQLVFLFAVAVVVVVGSERMYWFWQTSVTEHLAQAGFYLVPVAVTIAVVDRYRVDRTWPLLVATPIFGYVVEGALTPVLYEGGPLVPVFPAYFAFWHGIVAMAVGVFGVRAMLLRRAWRPLLAASVGLGALWGTWSTTLRLPESLEDAELLADNASLDVLGPAAFARYAVTFGLVFAVGHWVLGRVWHSRLTRSRLVTAIVGGLVVVAVVAWTVAVPWAAPTFVAYVGLHLWVLRRHRRSTDATSLLARLDGPVPVTALWPLAALPAMASVSYALWWELAPSEAVLRAVFLELEIAVHLLIGGAVTLLALLKTSRSATNRTRDQRLTPPRPGGPLGPVAAGPALPDTV